MLFQLFEILGVGRFNLLLAIHEIMFTSSKSLKLQNYYFIYCVYLSILKKSDLHYSSVLFKHLMKSSLLCGFYYIRWASNIHKVWSYGASARHYIFIISEMSFEEDAHHGLYAFSVYTQPAFTCLELRIKPLERRHCLYC